MTTIEYVINGISNIVDYIHENFNNLWEIYTGIDFGDLYLSIFPQDMANVTTIIVNIILFLSIIAVVRKVAFFIGG